MRLIMKLPAPGVAGTSAAVTLGLLLGVGITAQAQTNDPAESTANAQASYAQDPAGQDPTQTPQQPTDPGQPQAPTDPTQGAQPAGEGEEKPPQLSDEQLGNDTAILFYTVLPDKTTQFEQVMNKVKDALQQSDNPSRKEQAEGMRLMKQEKPFPDGSVLYALVITPVIADTEYEPGMIVFETFPDEANKLFKDFESFIKKDALTGVIPLAPVVEFGSGAAGGN